MKINMRTTTLKEARRFIRNADNDALRKAIRHGLWDAHRKGWILRGDDGEPEGCYLGGFPRGRGKDYRRAKEIVRRHKWAAEYEERRLGECFGGAI